MVGGNGNIVSFANVGTAKYIRITTLSSTVEQLFWIVSGVSNGQSYKKGVVMKAGGNSIVSKMDYGDFAASITNHIITLNIGEWAHAIIISNLTFTAVASATAS